MPTIDSVSNQNEAEEQSLDENMTETERLAYQLAGWVVQRGLMIKDIRIMTVRLWCEKNAPEVIEEQQTEILNIFPDFLIPLDSTQSRCAVNNATPKSGIMVPWRCIS